MATTNDTINDDSESGVEERPPVERPTRTVAIVGRPNVGKSALFNALAGRRISIVHETAGVTRDRIGATCDLSSEPFELFDTGGIGSDADADFSQIVETQVSLAIAASDLILFTVDGQEGLTPVDSTVAGLLRKSGKPVILVINKIDHPKHDALEADFARLGFPHSVRVSAAHQRGILDLVGLIGRLLNFRPGHLGKKRQRLSHAEKRAREKESTAAAVNRDEVEDTRTIELAIVGRPNVGKSSLINALVDDERTIVSDVAGTTRDAVDIQFHSQGRDYILIDTAGLRSRKRNRDSIEVFSAMRAERSIRRCDLCVLVIDASVGPTAQDQKIASIIKEAEKPCLIVANKSDLLPEKYPGLKPRAIYKELQDLVHRSLHFIDYASLTLLSALTGHRVKQLLDGIEQVREAASHHIGTGVLNRLFKEAMEYNPPPMRKNRRLKMLYATQVDNRKNSPVPSPTFMLFLNDRSLLDPPYERFLEGVIRQAEPFLGLPVIFRLRDRNSTSSAAASGSGKK